MPAICRRQALLAVLLTLVLVPVVQVASARLSPAQAAVTSRILITGDSITQGSAGDYTWRYRLWNKLASTEPGGVSFVGTRTDLFDVVNNKQGSQSYAASFTAKAHSALWGDSYVDELDKVAGEVTASNANVLVVMLGSNDLAYLTSPEATIANLKTYITRARAAAPGIDVVVGEVLNRYDPWSADYQITPQVNEYASRLATLATQLNTASERVVVALTRNGWDAKTETWDGTHPNPTGEALIAQRISEGLAKIGVGTASPDVSGARAWSVAGPTPSVTAGSEQASLAWNRTASGSNGMFIEQRLTNTGEAWHRLQYAVAGDSWTAELLAAGGTYEFRLVPAKGFSTGIAGPATSVTATGPAPGAIGSVGASPSGDSSYGGKKVVASWAASANATGYLLSNRIYGNAAAAWDDLPYPVTQRSWTFEPLYQGRRYQFRIRGSRGFLTSGWAASGVTRTQGIPADFVQASLGDSYSSGLGADGSYTGGDCMRADQGWVHDVYRAYRAFMSHLACAGATLPVVRGQLPSMKAAFAAHPGLPQLVTLTVGGNDVGFVDILSACVLGNCTDQESAIHQRIIGLASSLQSMYDDIRTSQPNADIIVGGYPDVVERSGGSMNPLCMRIDDPEREMIDRLVSHLNNTITDSAAAARVWTVGQELQAHFFGHNACADVQEEWIHAGNLDIGGQFGLIDKKSFHPNGSGQFEFATTINQVWAENAG